MTTQTDNDFARELNVQTTGCAIGWQWIGKTRQLTDEQKEVASRALGTNTDSLSLTRKSTTRARLAAAMKANAVVTVNINPVGAEKKAKKVGSGLPAGPGAASDPRALKARRQKSGAVILGAAELFHRIDRDEARHTVPGRVVRVDDGRGDRLGAGGRARLVEVERRLHDGPK